MRHLPDSLTAFAAYYAAEEVLHFLAKVKAVDRDAASHGRVRPASMAREPRQWPDLSRAAAVSRQRLEHFQVEWR